MNYKFNLKNTEFRDFLLCMVSRGTKNCRPRSMFKGISYSRSPPSLQQGCLPSVSLRRMGPAGRPSAQGAGTAGGRVPDRDVRGSAEADTAFRGFFTEVLRPLVGSRAFFNSTIMTRFSGRGLSAGVQRVPAWALTRGAAILVTPSERPCVKPRGARAWAAGTHRGNPRNVLLASSPAWARGAWPESGSAPPSRRGARRRRCGRGGAPAPHSPFPRAGWRWAQGRAVQTPASGRLAG